MSDTSVRRFLSGVCCPACGQADTVRVFYKEDQLWRDCVHCGLEESQDCEITQCFETKESGTVSIVRLIDSKS